MRISSSRATLVFAFLAGAATCALADAPAVPSLADAQKDGTVVWYATMNTKDLDATVRRFNRQFPSIRVQTLRVTSAGLPARVLTEQRAGTFNADLISGDEFQVVGLVSAGAIDRYSSPEAAKFIKGTVDPAGYWTNLYQNTTVIAWNPQRLRSDNLKAPASFDDFSKPEWKGRIGVDVGAYNWYFGMLQTRRDAADVVRRIAANEPIKTSGHTATVTQLESGEFDATPTAYGYLAEQEKRAGKAVDFVNTRPLLVTLNPIGLAKNAPHPNAARFLMNWLLSKDGQTFIAQQGGGEISSRVDVTSNLRIWNPAKFPYVIVHAPSPSAYSEAVREFRSIFGIPG